MNEQERELEGLEQYAIVAGRRQQWDSLLWQTPTLAMTGEAFFFTIALASSTSTLARAFSSGLAFLVAIATVHSLAAHRISELTDASWLHEYEMSHGGVEIHGLAWRRRRLAMVRDQLRAPSFTDRLVAHAYVLRSITVWFWTMTIIGVASLSIFILDFAAPHVFQR